MKLFSGSAVDPKLLNLLVCPVCKAKLVHDRETDTLVCRFEGLAYPVRDGIPVLIRSQATPVGGKAPEDKNTQTSD